MSCHVIPVRLQVPDLPERHMCIAILLLVPTHLLRSPLVTGSLVGYIIVVLVLSWKEGSKVPVSSIPSLAMLSRFLSLLPGHDYPSHARFDRSHQLTQLDGAVSDGILHSLIS
jgi:hypothetical protein